MNLTQNEQKVLKHLIDDGRASDMEIAKKLKISSQAVGKIRKKLEAERVILGYEANVNLEKLGITTFVITKLRPLPSLFEKMSQNEFFNYDHNPYVIEAFRVASNDLILLMGFRDQKELDVYSDQAMTKYGAHVTPVDMNVFSNRGILKRSEKGLLAFMLDSMGKPRKTAPLRSNREGVIIDELSIDKE